MEPVASTQDCLRQEEVWQVGQAGGRGWREAIGTSVFPCKGSCLGKREQRVSPTNSNGSAHSSQLLKSRGAIRQREILRKTGGRGGAKDTLVLRRRPLQVVIQGIDELVELCYLALQPQPARP